MPIDMLGGTNHTQLLSFAGFLPETKVETTSFASPSDLPRSLDFVRLTGILAHREVSNGQGSFELAVEFISVRDSLVACTWRVYSPRIILYSLRPVNIGLLA